MTNEQTTAAIKKILTSPQFANGPIRELVQAGKIHEAGELAARMGINGIAGALIGAEAVAAVHAAVADARKAKFSKK
jgi:hypothetical protein